MKKLLKLFFILLLLLNGIAILHAYKFTHYTYAKTKKIKAEELTTRDKILFAFTGVNNPKPMNIGCPAQPYETVVLQSNGKIVCWLMKAENAKGTVILFHGYTGEKSGMLDKAYAFLSLGYNTLLVDFNGSGASEGNRVTLGYYEAENVKTCLDYLKTKGEKNIYLFGTSMGAAAILRAIDKLHVHPRGIIIECPFGRMYDAVAIRFKMVHMPVFPMAAILAFWGGVENGFWAFSHNPEEYAKAVTCPALLMFGEKDDRVTRREIDNIYNNLQGKKVLKTYLLAGHEDYLIKYKDAWTSDIKSFLP